MVIYEPAVCHVLRLLEEENGIKIPVPTTEELSRWIGVSGVRFWDNLIPSITPEVKEKCYSLVGKHMCISIAEGRAQLYPGALEVLQEMKQAGYTLIFLSNCSRAYMDAHRDYFELDKYFDAFYCAEDYGNIPKFKIFDSIAADFPEHTEHTGEPSPCVEKFVIVGDTEKDYEVACMHNLPFIGCTYGYGLVENFPENAQLCTSVCEIPSAVQHVCQPPKRKEK